MSAYTPPYLWSTTNRKKSDRGGGTEAVVQLGPPFQRRAQGLSFRIESPHFDEAKERAEVWIVPVPSIPAFGVQPQPQLGALEVLRGQERSDGERLLQREGAVPVQVIPFPPPRPGVIEAAAELTQELQARLGARVQACVGEEVHPRARTLVLW